MSLLRLEGINTYYGQIHILQDENIVVGEGELVCLLGGNASGKSTTLKTILGLVRPRSGRVMLSGEDVHKALTMRECIEPMDTVLRATGTSLTVAGRTDAGVHASGQVIAFTWTPEERPCVASKRFEMNWNSAIESRLKRGWPPGPRTSTPSA